jgi:hypothetical protein
MTDFSKTERQKMNIHRMRNIEKRVFDAEKRIEELQAKVSILECKGHEWVESNWWEDIPFFYPLLGLVYVTCKKCGKRATMTTKEWGLYRLNEAKKQVESLSHYEIKQPKKGK